MSFTGFRFMVGSISHGPKYSSKDHGLRLYPRQRSGLFLPVWGGSLTFVITMGSHISKIKTRTIGPKCFKILKETFGFHERTSKD
jgi:hypothetical protein